MMALGLGGQESIDLVIAGAFLDLADPLPARAGSDLQESWDSQIIEF